MAFGASLIAQTVLPVSAWLAGLAFGMSHTHLGHFLAYTPLSMLAASVPVSPPQGFGVIEYVLFHFFASKGLATASQTFALAQSIRFLPILWNLIGAYWVVTGSYSRHQEDAAELESTGTLLDADTEPAPRRKRRDYGVLADVLPLNMPHGTTNKDGLTLPVATYPINSTGVHGGTMPMLLASSSR